MEEKKILFEGEEYAYLFTFGEGGKVYGNGDERIMVGEKGRLEMRYNVNEKNSIVLPENI